MSNADIIYNNFITIKNEAQIPLDITASNNFKLDIQHWLEYITKAFTESVNC